MLKSLKTVHALTNPRKIRVKFRYCPICERVQPIIRFNDNEIAIRCMVCRSSVVSMSMASVIKAEYPGLKDLSVYELSARGPLVKFLSKKCKSLTTSEFCSTQTVGEFHHGVLCQDVQKLTFDDDSFDLCTSTDVFEHVANDFLGLQNIYRVLKPDGKVVFTVPLWGERTVQRAKVGANGGIDHLLPPEFHGDPISTTGKILAFRNYGNDVLSLLGRAGFKNARIEVPDLGDFWSVKRAVIVAQK